MQKKFLCNSNDLRDWILGRDGTMVDLRSLIIEVVIVAHLTLVNTRNVLVVDADEVVIAAIRERELLCYREGSFLMLSLLLE